MSSPDGTTFDNKATLGDTSFVDPALAEYHGQLDIAWTGTDSGHHLNTMRSANGTDFGDKETDSDTSIAAPALASAFGRLFIAWTGTDGGHHLNVAVVS
jgi:hypothetical protein